MPDSTPSTAFWRRPFVAVLRWFDTAAADPVSDAEAHRIDWLRVLPFIGLHLACLGVIWVGVSWFAVAVAAALYAVRMFAITGFYHRYFSHKTFRTSRPVQFLFALLGASSVQRGPLWWAAHHRQHHRASDTPDDPHSPKQHGFWYSHMGWFLTRGAFRTDLDAVKDLAKFPELRLLDRFDILVPVLLAVGLFLGFGLYDQGFAAAGFATAAGGAVLGLVLIPFLILIVVGSLMLGGREQVEAAQEEAGSSRVS